MIIILINFLLQNYFNCYIIKYCDRFFTERRISLLNKKFKYPDTQAYNFVIKRLEEKGVTIPLLAQMAYDMQKDFEKHLTLDVCNEIIEDVLHKRELLNNAMVGLEMDRLVEQGIVKEPLASIIKNDAGVFGVDETLALQISNIYGTIGATNYGWLDREKNGVINKIDKDPEHVNTFADDLIAAIIAAACGKIAHQYA